MIYFCFICTGLDFGSLEQNYASQRRLGGAHVLVHFQTAIRNPQSGEGAENVLSLVAEMVSSIHENSLLSTFIMDGK